MEWENRIEWKTSSAVWLSWIVAIVVTAFLILIGYHLIPDFSLRPDLGALITTGGLMVLGAGIIVGMLTWVVIATRTAFRFGDAELELETVPVSLGGRLKGRIRAEATLAPDQALNLLLQCWARDKSTGDSGGGTHARWGSEHLLTLADIEQLDGQLLVPVDIAVPGDKPPTGNEDRHQEYWWTVSLSLEPGSGYKPEFRVPVLRTAESPPEPEGDQEPAIGVVGVMHKLGEFAAYAKDGTLAAAVASLHQEPPMERPPHARVEVRSRPGGGVEVVLPKTKASLVFVLWFLLTLPLWVILPALSLAELSTIDSPPVIAYLLYGSLGFGIPLILNGLPAISLAWQTRRLQVGTDGVIVQRRLGRRTHPPGKFTTAAALGSTAQGWSVGLDKSETTLLGGLQVASMRTGAEARWLAAELRRALGAETQT